MNCRTARSATQIRPKRTTDIDRNQCTVQLSRPLVQFTGNDLLLIHKSLGECNRRRQGTKQYPQLLRHHPHRWQSVTTAVQNLYQETIWGTIQNVLSVRNTVVTLMRARVSNCPNVNCCKLEGAGFVGRSMVGSGCRKLRGSYNDKFQPTDGSFLTERNAAKRLSVNSYERPVGMRFICRCKRVLAPHSNRTPGELQPIEAFKNLTKRQSTWRKMTSRTTQKTCKHSQFDTSMPTCHSGRTLMHARRIPGRRR